MFLFSQVELSHFSSIIYSKVNGQGIPCGHNSSYSYIPILLKLHWCFGHGLKICMWLRYNPQIIFVTYLQVELSHSSSILYNKVNGQGIPCGRNSSCSFIPILMKLQRCFGHGMKICMWFGYNPQIILSLFCKLNLVIFQALYITKWIDRGHLVGGHNTLYSYIPILLKLHWCFGHGLKICMWLRYTPQIIFCYFSCKLNLAIFRHYL